MPEVELRLQPGVNAEFTPALNESAIASSNLIRFKAGLPQKLGGWAKFFPSPVAGVPRAVHGWSDLTSANHLAVGSDNQLSVITNGGLQDVTPQTLTTNFTADGTTAGFTTTVGSPVVTITDTDPQIIAVFTTNDSIFFNTPVSVGGLILQGLFPIALAEGVGTYQIMAPANATTAVTLGGTIPSFTVTPSSPRVTVTFANHGLAAGDTFTFPIPTMIGQSTTTLSGGITIVGTLTVDSVTDDNNFVVVAPTSAAADADVTPVFMNMGMVQLHYFITVGPPPPGGGFGLGPFGGGGFGTGTTPAEQVGTPITSIDWSLDNFGEDLVANSQGGPLYFWQPNSGFATMELISTGPAFNNGCFVVMPEQILAAWGSTLTTGEQDQLIVRWSDSEDFTVWDVTSTTQAGSFRIPTGSRIVAGFQAPQQALIFTDIDVYAMQYLGPPFVFGFNKVASGCGLVGPHAVTALRGNIFWVSVGQIFMLSGGGVQSIPCPVWDVLYQDLDTANQNKIVCGANSEFDELFIFFPSISGATGECDKYIKMNVSEGSWDYGTLPRSCWMDQSVLGPSIGGNPVNNLIYQHEVSNDADGAPMISTFTTGYFVLSEGRDMVFVDWLHSDAKYGFINGPQTAELQVTINAANYPNDVPTTFGPFTMSQAVPFINLRLRNRLISLTFTSTDIGSFWRLGLLRIREAPAGRR